MADELVVVRGQVTKALSAANEITIANQTDLEQAVDVLSRIKKIGKMLENYKESLTGPLMKELKDIRDRLKPLEHNRDEADRTIKNKILTYHQEKQRLQDIETARLAARVEKGTMKQETAVAKMEAMPQVKKSTEGKVGKISTRSITKYRITDETKIPREYLTPDMGKITEAIKSGIVVPGAESYKEDVIQSW